MNKIRKLTYTEIAQKRSDLKIAHNVQRAPIYALLDNIRSMYNVGSIFRTSDGAFIDRVYLSGYTPTPDKPEVRKTALGATDTVPWEYSRDPKPIINHLKDQHITLCAVEQTTNSIPHYDLPDTIFPVCIVVGNELTGISDSILSEVDIAVEIPMFGSKQSLNVAVAFGIVLFDLMRKFTAVSHRS
jgi:23S rRNA (guanosine2251-2'-O)-methyltransferase